MIVEILKTLFDGICVGLASSMTVGPVAVLCIQRTLSKGGLSGIMSGMGVACADTLLAILAFSVYALLKTYIDGMTVQQLVEADALPQECILQMQKMCQILYPAGLNIDYYPTNFVFAHGILYYIDYECNPYSRQWDFENWGIQYWQK